MTEDAKWLYSELKKRGADVGNTEAEFEQIFTSNEDDMKWLHETSKNMKLDVDDSYDTFVTSFFPKENKGGFLQRTFGNTAQAQMYAKQAEDAAKKKEQERIRQEKINLGISDKDKQDVMELVELEQKAANPVSISTNGVMEVRTPKPELNQYGMPTKIAKPVNPDVERQVETKKAQMPAYLTRGENTTMDIAQNAYDRAMNTEEGKNIITSIQNKYVSEFKQSEMYKALLKDFYDGKATEDDLNNAFDEQYGQKMNDDIREGILGEKGLMREYYDDASNKLEARLHARDAFDVSSRIKAERDRQYEAFQNSIKSKRDENGINISVDIDAFKPDRMLNHAEQFNNDALDLIDAVEKERGFGKGIGNALVDIDTYTALAELSRTKELIDVLDKVEGDEALSEREELMLDAALNYFAVSSYYGDKLGRWYKAGQTTGASLPFIVQFMVTSGALAGAEAAVEGGAKSVGKRIAKNLVKHGYKKFARDLSSKAVTIPLAMLGGLAETGVEAGVMTAVFGLPQIEAGTQRRMLGHVKTGYNPETGKLEYLGREQQQTEEEARKNAMIDTYAEYLSEMVLTKTFSPLTDYIGTAKWFKDFQRDDVVGTIVDIWNNPTWKSARAATKFGSLPEEDLEEQVGGWMRLAFASDVNTMEDAGLDLDSQIDIVLGLAPTSLVFGGIGTASYYGGLRRNAKYIKQSLSSDAQRELFDKLMEESRSGQFGDLAHDMIRNIVLDNEMSIEDKKTNITSIVAEYQELLSKETQELAKEINKTENAANIDEFISNTRNGATDYIYQTIDSKGRVCYITDGEIGLSKSEDGLYRIDQPKKSRNVKVRYRMADGSFTEPFELSTAQLTAPVNAMNTEKFKDLELAKSLAKTTGEKTFEYDGVVYDTETGIKLGSKEEYAKKQDELQKKEEEENKDKEPVVSTRPHKIHGVFTVNLNGEEVTMKVFSRNATQKKDGSIKGGTFSISVDGEVVTGERREALVEALSNKFKADHAKSVEEYNQRKAEEAAANTVEPQPLISDEDRAAAAAEAQKKVEQQTILDSIAGKKGKNGNIDLKKLTPEEMVVHLMYNIERKDVIKLIGSRINNLHKKIADIEEDDKKDELEKYTETEPLRNELQAYEDAIVKWVGQDALETINAARAEALKLDTPPVQEGAPIVAPVVEPVQGETPAEPTVASKEDAPQDNVPAEPDTTPLPPAEPVVENGKVNEEEKEPMNLLDGQYAIVSSNSTRGKEQIVKVTQNEDGTETWTSIHDGKTVSQGAYKKQQFPEQDNMRVLGIKEGNTVTPVIVLSGRADLSQEKGELKVVPVNTKDGKIHEVHVSLLYKPEADGGWSLLKGVGSRVLSPAEAAKYNSLDALLDFPIIPNVTVGNFTLKDMLEYPTLGKLKARLDQLGIEYDKQTINTNLETALARWRELVRENNLNDEFQSNVGKLNLYCYNIYRAGVEPFKAGVPVEDTKRTRSNKNLYIQLDTIGMLPNNITNPVVQLAVLTDIASQLGIVRPKENGRYIDSIEPIIAKTEKEIKANEEEFTGKPKGTVEKADEDKQPDQQKPKAQKPKTETKEETPAPAQRKTNIDNLRDTFVEAYARTQNQSYNALQKTTAKNAFKGMIDKMSEEDAIALYLNLAMESAKSQGKMQEDMVNAAKALLDSKHGAAINAITGGAQQETNPTPVETTEEATEETEQTAEDSIDYEALVAERNELQETIYDMEDDEAANANARIAQINEILRNRAEFMVGDVVTEHTESTKRIIKILKAAGIRVVTFKNEDLPKYVSKKKLEELSDGQIVYGFASNDTIYLNEDHFNPNSPLHEFTHLWVTAYKQAFPNEWKRFVEIANKSALAANLRKPLKDGNASPYAKLSADEMASEVLSRYTGYLYGELDSDGRTAFENMMQAQTMEEKIAEKSLLKRIRDFWKKVISFFDKSIENEKEEDAIDSMIRQFAQAPMETLARGKEGISELKRDAEYMDAVNRGDMETAQRLVNEAAKMSMPNTKVVDEKGNPLIVFHGSPYSNITTFDHTKGSQESGLKEYGTYFTSNPLLAELYKNGRSISEEMQNKIDGEIAKLREQQNGARNNREYDALENEINLLKQAKEGKVYPCFLNIETPKEFDAKHQDGWAGWHELRQDVGYDVKRGTQAIEAITGNNKSAVMDEQYDGIIAHDIMDIHSSELKEELFGDAYLVWNPTQIKSAEPVTYDDNGNVIPLSERFNLEKDDIRYMIMLNNTSENLDNSKKSSTFAQNNENYERTDEFRELQERSLGLSQSRISEFHSKERELSDEDRRRVGGVFQRLMDTDRNGGRNGQWINLTGKGNQFKITQVNPAIFHDIFQICRNYLPNGELVDLHDNYADCKCFISEDGLCGFAIEPNGNLISVFSLNPSDKKGFLYAIKDLIRQEGATHLDCYVSSKQPLAGIYQKALGFHVASEMDYNMEYDHDNIAENHGMPKVAFMVNKPVEKKSFDENSYDEAVEYQQQNIERNNEYDLRQGNRAILRERFRDEELQGSNGLLEEAEASLQRGGYRSSPETTSSKLADFELAAQQEQELEAFAKENGVWIDDTSSYLREKYGEPFAEGGESVIYLSEDGTKVLKENSLAYFVEPQLALDRLVLHNSFGLSKIAPLTLTHFGRNENGEFVMIVEQPYIKGEEVTQDEIVEAMQALGYELYTSKKTEFVNKEEGIVINDLHDENVIRLEDGSIVVIDGDFRLNTSNLGLGGTRTTTPQVEDIDFMIGPAGAPLDPMLFDAEAAAKIQIKTHKLLATFANPKASLPEEFSAMRELVATSLDRTEGIRWMMESIEKFRKEHGMPELGEGFDVRTMVEAMDSKIQNDTQAYINTTEKRLRKNIKELADRVESSSFYKMHKIEREPDQDGKEVELTALQMIERYLIACDSIEREQLNGNPRGLADFYRRMGMDVYEFAEAFNIAFFSSSKGKKQFDELWDSIRACTNVSIDMGWQSGLISLEEYTEYKKRRYYVPERDFAEVENNEELAIDSHGYRGKNSNKLTAMKQAKGGDSLAANVLANICLHARDGIIKSHRNAVKKAMFDLLRANEEWCREYKVPIPKQVWYQKNEDGTVSRMVDGPSAEDRKLMADLKSQIRDIENEIINLQQLADAATDESVKEAYENDIADLREQIDMLTDMFPYLDEFDTRSFIFMTNAAKNESTVMVYVDGVAQEMIFPNMSIIAKALNGTYNKEGEVGFAKQIGQYFAAGLTVYNPAFFTVNIVRDVPFIMKKGFAEYGFTFGARFIARMAEKLFNRELWKVVWNSDYKSLKDEHLREFFAGGANTGYTTIPEIRELKKQTKKWNDKKIIEWSDVKDLLSYMNTFSEVWTRSAAYSVVRDMGHTNEEAIKAAKNLSVNFNRKGLGNPFMNFFGSLSIFMNAAIQGACGYWRAFKGNEDTLPLRVWHGTRAAMQFMLLPAFTGFISTLLNPDDDDEKLYYSDYDRDNYALLGFLKEGIRIPLSEQVKPFWCMGVNIALGIQGRRTKEQITNSMVSTVVTNLLPLPPVLNSTIVMATNGLTGQKDFTPFQVVENMITPQALSGIYDLSNNVNFMGTDIRIEAGDKPQYMLGENEEYFCRQVAWWAYLISGGNRDYPSRTTTDGDKIWADWNPKQVSAVRNMVIPSTYRDVTDFFTRVVINAAYPDNPYHGEEAKWEDFATVRRFYKPRDREMGMYSIAKDAKEIVKANNERKANAQKLVKGGAITKNNAMRDEAELRLRQTLSNRDAKLMSEYITVCEQLSIRESAKEYGLTEKQFMDALRKNNKEVYKVLMKHNNITREKAADKLLQLTRKYKSISIEDMTLLEAFGVEE